MAQKTPPESEVMPPERHDPFKLTSLEKILLLFDGGAFLSEIMSGHRDLQKDLLEHREQHGTKGCKGTMTIQVTYDLRKAGDVAMGASVKFTKPTKPASSAAAYINDHGELTLYSPMMARMHTPVRDVPAHDPETGEIRDVD